MSRLPCAVGVVVICVFACQLSVVKTQADEPKPKVVSGAQANDQQVIIKTQLIEINRSKLRRLGVDFSQSEVAEKVLIVKDADGNSQIGLRFGQQN